MLPHRSEEAATPMHTRDSSPSPDFLAGVAAPAPAPPASPRQLIRLRSVVERLELRRLFPCERPLELELGCGDGSFLVQSARLHPDRNFLGIERLLGRARKVERKAQRAGLENLRLLSIEAGYFLEFLLPPESVEVLHVYFPDPWPKRRHWKHRLVNGRFVELVERALLPGGEIHLRTDDKSYYAQMTSVFDASAAFNRVETPADLRERFTDFEREFRARGVQTLSASYRRQPGVRPTATRVP
jgi:tRNA (guanine-N7-)-methyltransferase